MGKIYFISDCHLGAGTLENPLEYERRVVRFLESIEDDCEELFLMGDIIDYWFEFKYVVPRGFTRFLGKLAMMADKGVKIHWFTGNHDIWCYSFFESIGMRKCAQPQLVEIGGKSFCLGHGDALGGARPGYKFMLKVFNSRITQGLFSTLHPRIAFALARKWSGGKRSKRPAYHFRGEQEPLYQFALEQSSQVQVDYFIFGHFHDAVDLELPTGARLIVLKDWLSGGTPHARFDLTDGSLTIEPSSN